MAKKKVVEDFGVIRDALKVFRQYIRKRHATAVVTLSDDGTVQVVFFHTLPGLHEVRYEDGVVRTSVERLTTIGKSKSLMRAIAQALSKRPYKENEPVHFA